jgi:hypothetical protein
VTSEAFDAFRNQAVHELKGLNEHCERTFRIGNWEHWDYDLDAGTLIFSEKGVPQVAADIQVVGTTSTASQTWLWGWANDCLPTSVTTRILEVREFGQTQQVSQLTEPQLSDDEYLGWEMTAVAARIINAKGAYRCPSTRGFLYLVYTAVRFAASESVNASTPALSDRRIDCGIHGEAQKAFVCEHLVSNPEQQWFSDRPAPSNPWPDAWCAQCDEIYQEQGEWNDTNEERTKIKLLCHLCYESLRKQDPTSRGDR